MLSKSSGAYASSTLLSMHATKPISGVSFTKETDRMPGLPKTSHVRRVEDVRKDSQKSLAVSVKEVLEYGTDTQEKIHTRPLSDCLAVRGMALCGSARAERGHYG